MKFHWSSRIVAAVVFFLVLGTFSTGYSVNNKSLVIQKKAVLQKTAPLNAKTPSIKHLPDLTVTELMITPSNPVTGEEVNINASVKNTGKGNSQPCFLKIQIGVKKYPLIRVPGLVHNKTWQYKTKIQFKNQGRYRVTAVVNPDRKLVESDYKNNTLIKNFAVKKATLKTKPPVPSNPSQQTMSPLTSTRPLKLALQYPVTVAEAQVLKENGMWIWKARIKNTGTRTIPERRLRLQAMQISNDGSEHLAGNPDISYVSQLEPGETCHWRGLGGWAKIDNANRLRVEVIDLESNMRAASKVIQFPSMFSGVMPKFEVQRAVQFNIGISDLRIKKIQGYPNKLQWNATLTNNGTNTPANYRLHAKAFIIFSNGTEQKTSSDRLLQTIFPGQSISTSNTIGDKDASMRRLRLEIWDTDVNFRIANQTIDFPSDEELNQEPEIRAFRIQSSEYLGNGRWRIAVENAGNCNINPDEITITAKYHIGQAAMPQSMPYYNSSVIQPGHTEFIEGFGLSNEDGCDDFSAIDIFVYDSVGDRTRTDVINTPDRVEVTITDVNLRNSQLSWHFTNRTPYPVKVTVILENVEIWDGPKPQSNNNSWWEDIVDFVDGADFDSSGLQPPERKATATNITLGTWDLNAATSTPGPGQSWIMIGASDVNSLIRAKCPGVSFSDYSYMFKNLRIKVVTAVTPPANVGNATGPQFNCNTSRFLDRETVSAGGSHDNPAFSW